jgi:heme/copper-type cytochrome/quinol oxidase subunit 3
MIESRPTIDVSALPENNFEHRATLWWGNVVMLMIEGTMLAIVWVSYFYYRENFTRWPPPPTNLPDLLPGTIVLVLMLAATVPMVIAHRRAITQLRPKAEVMPMLWLTTALALAANVVRIWELPAMHCRWNEHVYGSVTWSAIGFHWVHLAASMVETLVLAIYLINHDLDRKKRVDLNCDMIYWYFVVVSGAIGYIVIYWSPRWL